MSAFCICMCICVCTCFKHALAFTVEHEYMSSAVSSFENMGIEFTILMALLPFSLEGLVRLPLVGPGSLLTSSG